MLRWEGPKKKAKTKYRGGQLWTRAHRCCWPRRRKTKTCFWQTTEILGRFVTVMCFYLTFQQRTCALSVGLGRVETGGWNKAPPEQSISKSCGTRPMRSLTVQRPWQFGCRRAMNSELKFSQATTLGSSKTPPLWETLTSSVCMQNYIWSYVISWFYIDVFVQYGVGGLHTSMYLHTRACVWKTEDNLQEEVLS